MSDIEESDAKRPPPISIEEFDRRAENGAGLDEYFDWSRGAMVEPGELSPGQILSMQMEEDASGQAETLRNAASPRPLNVSLPSWALERLESAAIKRGLRQEDLAFFFIVQQLDKLPA